MLLSSRNDQLLIHNNMNRSQKHYAVGKKPDTKKHVCVIPFI